MSAGAADATLPPVRLPRALLVAARTEAARRDETLSQVVRRALRAYVGQALAEGELEVAIDAAAPRATRKRHL